MRRLVILSGLAKGRTVELTQSTISIGCADENHLVLDDISVSRRHAVLTFDGQEYRLRDVGSRNGTRVNQKPIQETRLVPGDVIQLGEVEIRYELPGARVVSPPAPTVPAAELERVKQLQAEVERLAAQNRELSAKVQAAQTQLAEAQQRAAELAQVQAELQQARQAANALQQEKQTLASQLQAAEQRAQAAVREAEQRAAGEIARITGELARVNQELAQLRAATGQQQAVQADLAALQREKESLSQQLAAARQQLAETEQRWQARHQRDLAQLTAELQRVTGELEQTRGRAAAQPALAAQVETLQRERAALSEQLASLHQQLERVRQETTAQIEAERQRLSAELERVRAESAQAQAEAEQKHAAALAQVQALERQREQLQAELARAQQQTSEAETQARERDASLRADWEAAQRELAMAREELASTRAARQRVAELTEQNRVLENRLAQVQADWNTARAEAEAARRRVAELESAAGQSTSATAAELARVREELVRAQAAATQVATLVEERQRLATQLIAVEQQLIGAREQAQREAATARRLEEELERVRQQLELAKKETAKIEIKRPAAKPAGEAESKRLQAELTIALARLQELSGELARTKSELEELRRNGAGAAVIAPVPGGAASVATAVKPVDVVAAPTVEAKAPVAVPPVPAEKVEPPAKAAEAVPSKSEQLRRHFENQITELENKIAEATKAGMAADAEPMRRWKSELAVLRANLFNLTAATPVAVPVATPKPLGVPARGGRPWLWLVALVVVLGMLWWWMGRSGTPRSLEPAPPGSAVTPVVPPKVITEPPGTSPPSDNGGRPGAVTPQKVESPAVTPAKPTPAKPVEPSGAASAPGQNLSAYRDSRGRFAFWVPDGWRVETKLDTGSEAIVWLVSEPNLIKVEVHGTDWPQIERDDLPRLQNLLADRIRVEYPHGLYGVILDSGLRTIAGQQAGYAQCQVTLGNKEVYVRAVEFRKAGRAHYIELHVHTPEQKALLDLLFEQFLQRYWAESVPRP